MIPDDAVLRYRQGETARKLSREFGVSETAIIEAYRRSTHTLSERGRCESPAMRKFASWQEHFWSLVDKSGDCWLWQGSRDRKGYGNFHDKRMPGKHAKVHRLAFELVYGPILVGLFVCHRCDNPPCINLAHLFAGTHQDNMQDAAQKNRLKIPRRAKLTVDQVQEIRMQCASGLTQEVTAQKFGVDQAQVWRIVHGKNWSNVA